MRLFRLCGFAILLAMTIAACQPSPPTVVYIVISPTPEEDSPTVSQEPVTEAQAATSESEEATEPAPTATVTPTPAATNTPAPTATPDIFPTVTVSQIQVAEQVYENGRMMWVQPNSQIWVMILDEEGGGRWLRYEDTWDEETDPETDPSLEAPEGRIQPERGFGKLWRENPEIRESLGWAITPEFGYISEYQYRPGGTVEDGEFVPAFGRHRLFSLNGEAFTFYEETETWELGG